MKRAVVRDRVAGVLYPGTYSFKVGLQLGADMFMDLVNSRELIVGMVSNALQEGGCVRQFFGPSSPTTCLTPVMEQSMMMPQMTDQGLIYVFCQSVARLRVLTKKLSFNDA